MSDGAFTEGVTRLPLEFQPESVPPPAAACDGCHLPFRAFEASCPTCGRQRGAPNVLAASTAEQQEALARRVAELLKAKRSREAAPQLESFAACTRESVAVVNLGVRDAAMFLSRDRNLYATYERQVAAGFRLPAAPVDDRHRAAVAGLMFGSDADEIRYAALSIDGRGLVSYGAVTLVLKDSAVRERASVLEENSYRFVANFGLVPGAPPPAGHLAPWQTRHLLAVAKLAPRIDTSTGPTEFGSLLLTARDRANDEFIEVHIYGPFDPRAVARVRVPAEPPADTSVIELELLRCAVRTAGIPLEET